MPHQDGTQLHRIFLQAPAAIAILEGPDQKFVLANEKYLQLYNRTWKQVYDKTLIEVFPELQDQKINEQFKKVYTTGELFSDSEFLSIWNDENGIKIKRYFNLVLQPIKNVNGEVVSVMLHSYEVTDQVKANKLVQESEERYNTMLMHSPFAFAVLKGEDMIINFANDAMKGIWKTKEVEGMKLLDLRPDLKNQEFPALLKNVMETGIPFHGYELHVTFLRNDQQEEGYFNFVYQPYREADDIITGVTIIAVEVTEKVAAKKKIIESEKRFRNMVQHAPVAICVLRTDKYIVEVVNTKMLEIWGKHGDELINRPVFEAMPDAAGQGFEQLLDSVYQTGKPYIADELPVTLKRNGILEEIFISFVYEALYDEHKNINGVIAVASEITEQVMARRKIEESEKRYRELALSLEEKIKERTAELEKQNEDLEKMNEELASFTYVSSHDLQEPLRKIQMFSGRIMEKEINNLSDEGKNYFERMQVVANRMQLLINDLLAYSRTNNKSGNFELTDINNMIDEVKAEFLEKLEEKNAVIDVAKLPKMKVIPFQFRQLWLNLISNALKFSRAGVAPVIKISYETVLSDDLNIPNLPKNKVFYHITIEDNGIGFHEKYNEQIFGMLQRLHERQVYEGTGIGLAIVKKIVQNHHGFITATGKENTGATFDIYLPVN
jgi:hypothetical protein